MQQISSGLYGAIVVVDPAAPRDTTRDRVLLFSDDGPLVDFFALPPKILLNGKRQPAPIELAAGVPHRLRLVNIRSEALVDVELLDGDTPVEWRVVAVDGADTPPQQAGPVPARMMFASGQIRDVELPARPAGRLRLRYKLGFFPPEAAHETGVEVVIR